MRQIKVKYIPQEGRVRVRVKSIATALLAGAGAILLVSESENLVVFALTGIIGAAMIVMAVGINGGFRKEEA